MTVPHSSIFCNSYEKEILKTTAFKTKTIQMTQMIWMGYLHD